ncbi:MAG: hypothetical protein AAGF49_16390, partial [Pseudomonadota bacterium]
MTVTAAMRTLLARAGAEGLAFALWRMPGGAAFRAAIAMGPAAPVEVFAGAGQPAFALGRFNTADPARPDAIAADILLDGETVRFWTGDAYASSPATALQRALINALQRALIYAPQRAPSTAAMAAPLLARGGTPPAATSQASYEALVTRALGEIAAGRARKIVLSRADVRPLAPGRDLIALTEMLGARHPGAFVALASTPSAGTWVT